MKIQMRVLKLGSLLGCLCAVLLFLTRVSYEFWIVKPIMEYRSPDRLWQAQVREDIFRGQILVELTSRSRKLVLARRYDDVVYFAQIAWSSDSHIVGVLVRDGSANPLRLAFNVTTRSPVPFELTADLLREAIRRDYELSDDQLSVHGGDPLRWAEFAEPGTASGPATLPFAIRYRKTR